MTRLPLRYSPRPVQTLCDRVRTSPLARDIEHSGGWLAFWCAALLVTAFLIGALSAGFVVTSDGVYEVPSPPSCGDYCGGDAGLIVEPADTP